MVYTHILCKQNFIFLLWLITINNLTALEIIMINNTPFTRSVGVNASRLLWMEWRQALNWIELNCGSIASLHWCCSRQKLKTFHAPTQASANQTTLCKYRSADTSQSRSLNTRKICDRLLPIWRSRQHQSHISIWLWSAPSFRHALRQALTPMPMWMGRNMQCHMIMNCWIVLWTN